MIRKMSINKPGGEAKVICLPVQSCMAKTKATNRSRETKAGRLCFACYVGTGTSLRQWRE